MNRPTKSEWRMDRKKLDSGRVVYIPYRLLDKSLEDTRYREITKIGFGKGPYKQALPSSEKNREHPRGCQAYDTEEECQAAIDYLNAHPKAPCGVWKSYVVCGDCKRFKSDKNVGRVNVPGTLCAVRLGKCEWSGKYVDRCAIIHECPVNRNIIKILES